MQAHARVSQSGKRSEAIKDGGAQGSGNISLHLGKRGPNISSQVKDKTQKSYSF